jgi:hypothetical protein
MSRNFHYISPDYVMKHWIEDESNGDEIKIKCPGCHHNSAFFNIRKNVGTCMRSPSNSCIIRTIKTHTHYNHLDPSVLYRKILQHHQRRSSALSASHSIPLDLKELSLPSLAYLESRKIHKETVQHFKGVFEITRFDGTWLAWPTIENHYSFRSTSIKEKKKNKRNSSGHQSNFSIFGLIYKPRTIVVVESLITGMSHYQLFSPDNSVYVVLNSVTNTDKFIDAALTMEHLKTSKFILALDNDEAGIAATNKLITFCQQNALEFVVNHVPIDNGDWNDFLLSQSI